MSVKNQPKTLPSFPINRLTKPKTSTNHPVDNPSKTPSLGVAPLSPWLTYVYSICANTVIYNFYIYIYVTSGIAPHFGGNEWKWSMIPQLLLPPIPRPWIYQIWRSPTSFAQCLDWGREPRPTSLRNGIPGFTPVIMNTYDSLRGACAAPLISGKAKNF